jgi:putative inorganic carbon (hco3(-)) transporter
VATGGRLLRQPRADASWLLALAGVASAGLLFGLSAYVAGPLALPAAVIALAFVVLTFRRPAYGVAGALLATALESLTLPLAGGVLSPAESALVVVGVGWLCRALLAPGTVAVPSLRDAPLLALLGVVACGLLVAVDPAPVLRVLILWTLFYFVYLQVQTFTAGELRLVAGALAVGVGVLGAVGALAYVRSGDAVLYAGGELTGSRAIGAFADANYYACLLALGTLPGLALIAERPRKRAWLIPFAAAGVAGLTLSLSRGAMLGFAAGVLLLLAWNRFRTPAVAFCVLFAVLTLANVNPIAGSEQFGNVRTRLETLTSSSLEQTNRRPQLWSAALSIAASHPLIGVGVNQFEFQTDRFALTERGSPLENAHSLPLSVAAETGLLGLAAFLAFAGQLVVRASRAWRARGSGNFPLALGVTAALAAFALQGLTIVPIRANLIMGTFLVLAGMLTALADRSPGPRAQRP